MTRAQKEHTRVEELRRLKITASIEKTRESQTAEDEESLVSVVDSLLVMQHHKSYAELCNSIAGGTTATHQAQPPRRRGGGG